MSDLPLTKVCTKCGLEKSLSEFSPKKDGKFGVAACCKKCKSKIETDRYAYDSDFREKKKTRERERRYTWTPEELEVDKQNQREYWTSIKEEHNADRRRRYSTDPVFRTYSCQTSRIWYKDNKEYAIARETIRQREKRQTDLNFRIRGALRSRLICAIKADQKKGSGVRDLGCSIEKLKKHLESKFQPGMSWDNWGLGEDKWNIDHIIPMVAFDLTNRQHVVLACHYLNLQPLWYKENLSKGSKYPHKEIKYANIAGATTS